MMSGIPTFTDSRKQRLYGAPENRRRAAAASTSWWGALFGALFGLFTLAVLITAIVYFVRVDDNRSAIRDLEDLVLPTDDADAPPSLYDRIAELEDRVAELEEGSMVTLDVLMNNSPVENGIEPDEARREMERFYEVLPALHRERMAGDAEYRAAVREHERATGERLPPGLLKRKFVISDSIDGSFAVTELENSFFRRKMWRGFYNISDPDASIQTVEPNTYVPLELEGLRRLRSRGLDGAGAPEVVPSTVSAEIRESAIVADFGSSVLPIFTTNLLDFSAPPAQVLAISRPGTYTITARLNVLVRDTVQLPALLAPVGDLAATTAVSGPGLASGAELVVFPKTAEITGTLNFIPFILDDTGADLTPQVLGNGFFTITDVRGSVKVQITHPDTQTQTLETAFFSYDGEYNAFRFPRGPGIMGLPQDLPATTASVSGVRIDDDGAAIPYTGEFDLAGMEFSTSVDWGKHVQVVFRGFNGNTQTPAAFFSTTQDFPTTRRDAPRVYMRSAPDANTINVELPDFLVRDTSEVIVAVQHQLPGNIDVFLRELTVVMTNDDSSFLSNLLAPEPFPRPPGFQWPVQIPDVEG